MIDTKELKLGNWVLDLKTNTEVQVTGILEDGAYLDGAISVANYDSEIKPIPLTEDWLAKFGFEKGIKEKFSDNSKRRHIKYHEDDHWAFCIYYQKENSYQFYFDGYQLWVAKDIEINYIHQLQNLFFAITNKELEIK